MLRRLANDQRGAVALMTLVFMLLLGAVSIIFLWTLAYVTGAYNTLYIANQNAAIAAATTPGGSIAGGTNGQLAYSCPLWVGTTVCEFDPRVTSGQSPAAGAASLVMRESLRSQPFGLNFTGSSRNTVLLNPLWAFNGQDPTARSFSELASETDAIQLFNVQRSAGELKAMLSTPIPDSSGAPPRYPECQINGQYFGTIPSAYSGGDPPGTIHCWQVKEGGITFDPQFTSGVITRALAEVNLLPGCQLDFCTTNIMVTAAAAQQQLYAPDDYADYLTP